MPSPTPASVDCVPGACWWCRGPADSREHKFKRSDLVREYGAAPYLGGAELSIVGANGSIPARSNKSRVLKFKPNLCQTCNNARSQPFDQAYDQFVSWIFADDQEVLDSRSIDLSLVFRSDCLSSGLNVLRYFAKHICCRLADLGADGNATTIPSDVIDFLDGGPAPKSLSCELYIEPALLRFAEARPKDPLWIKHPPWIDVIFGPGPDGDFLQSRWRYGWLTLAWAIGAGADGTHPFSSQRIHLPLLATSWTPPVEFAFASMRFMEPPSGTAESETIVDAARAEKMQPLWNSPVALWFIAGALDFEAGLRQRAPDERRNVNVDDPTQVSLERELRRMLHLVIACSDWALGDLAARTGAALGSFNLGRTAEEQLSSLTVFLQSTRDTSRRAYVLATELACEATASLARCYATGPESLLGQQALVEAARLAGCCLIAAAFARNDLPGGFGVLQRIQEELAAVD